MTSRRKFLSNAFGIALVSATTWPIRADQARSTQGQSNTSRSKAGRTTRNNISEMGRVPGAQHTCHHERFASGRKTAAVAADFVNPYFRGAGRCAGRHPHYRRAGASTWRIGLRRAERI